jgi:hypothetical protein
MNKFFSVELPSSGDCVPFERDGERVTMQDMAYGLASQIGSERACTVMELIIAALMDGKTEGNAQGVPWRVPPPAMLV